MNFEDLEIWKRSKDLSVDIYRRLRDLRDYGFKDQITRAGLSVPSNIAEGFERSSARELITFLNYARGSCGELRTQIYIGMEIGYIDAEVGRKWVQEAKNISAMISALIKTRQRFLKAK